MMVSLMVLVKFVFRGLVVILILMVWCTFGWLGVSEFYSRNVFRLLIVSLYLVRNR